MQKRVYKLIVLILISAFFQVQSADAQMLKQIAGVRFSFLSKNVYTIA